MYSKMKTYLKVCVTLKRSRGNHTYSYTHKRKEKHKVVTDKIVKVYTITLLFLETANIVSLHIAVAYLEL